MRVERWSPGKDYPKGHINGEAEAKFVFGEVK